MAGSVVSDHAEYTINLANISHCPLRVSDHACQISSGEYQATQVLDRFLTLDNMSFSDLASRALDLLRALCTATLEFTRFVTKLTSRGRR